MKQIISRLMALAIAVGSSLTANAAKYYLYSSDGEWHDYNVWSLEDGDYNNDSQAVPSTTDDVVIREGQTVYLKQDATINTLQLDGEVIIQGGSKLTVADELSGVGELVTPTLDNLSITTNSFAATGTLAISGTAYIEDETFTGLTVRSGATLTLGDSVVVTKLFNVEGTASFVKEGATLTVAKMIVSSNGVFSGYTGNYGEATCIKLSGDAEIYGKLNLASDLANDDTNTSGKVILNFVGGNEQSFRFSGQPTCNVYRLLVSKTTGTTVKFYSTVADAVEFRTYVNCNAGEQPIVLESGTLMLGENIVINRIGKGASGWSTADYDTDYFFYIPYGATLSIGGATVNAGYYYDEAVYSNRYGSLLVEGGLEITSGSLSTDDYSSGILFYGSNATIDVDGGTLDVSAIRAYNSSAQVQYTQTNGEVNINKEAAQHSTGYCSFTIIGDASTFTMSGGNLNIVKAGNAWNPNGMSISVDATRSQMSGGQITINTSSSTDSLELLSNVDFYNLSIVGTPVKRSGLWQTMYPLTVKNKLSLSDSASLTVQNQDQVYVYLAGDVSISENSKLSFGAASTTYLSGSSSTTITNASTSNTLGNLVVEKSSSSLSTTISGEALNVAGNIEAKYGTLYGPITMTGSSTTITQGSNGSFAGTDFTISDEDISLASAVEMNSISVSASNPLTLGTYNLKLNEALTTTADDILFYTSGNESDGGLTQPIAANATVMFPFGVLDDDEAICLSAKITSNGSEGTMTIAPNNGRNQVLYNNATSFFTSKDNLILPAYWKVNWSGDDYEDGGLTYLFHHTENVSGLYPTRSKNVYQYTNNAWNVATGSCTAYSSSSHGTMSVTGFNDTFSGIFTATNKSIIDSFTGGGDPTTYYSVSSGGFNDNIWSTDSLATTGECRGSSIGSGDIVVIQNGHTVNAVSSKTFGELRIKEGGTFSVGSSISGVSISYLYGQGTLLYKVNGSYDNHIYVDYSSFLAEEKANITYEYESNMMWSDYFPLTVYPNLILRSSDETVVRSVNDTITNLTVYGNLSLQDVSLTLNASNGSKVVYTFNGNVSIDAESTLSAGSGYNQANYYNGSINNEGTFIDGGNSTLLGNIENDGIFTSTGTYFSLQGEDDQTISGTNSLSISHLEIAKTDVSCLVDLKAYVEKSAGDGTTEIDLQTGALKLNASSGTTWTMYSNEATIDWSTTYTKKDLTIPTTGSIEVANANILKLAPTTTGSENATLALNGKLTLSAKSAAAFDNGGIYYSNTGSSQLNIGSGSQVKTLFVQPSAELGQLTYYQYYAEGVPNLILLDGYDDYGTGKAALDIRGGTFYCSDKSEIVFNGARGGQLLNYSPSNSAMNITTLMTFNASGTASTAVTLAKAYIDNAATVTFNTAAEFAGLVTINNGSLAMQGYDLTLKRDLTINESGSYAPGENTTYMDGSAGQTVTCSSGDLVFYNLTKTSAAKSLTFATAIGVEGVLQVLGDVMTLNADSYAKGDVTISSGASIAGSELDMQGEGSTLDTKGSIDKLQISNDVDASSSQDESIVVNKSLVLNAVLNIGQNLLELGSEATITTENTDGYGLDCMIYSTNGAQSKGILMNVATTTSSLNFTLPMGGLTASGNAEYMPIVVNVTPTSVSDGASLQITPVAQKFISLSSVDALKHYWTVIPKNIGYDEDSETNTLTMTISTANAENFNSEIYDAGILPDGETKWKVYEYLNDNNIRTVVEADGTITATFPFRGNGEYTCGSSFPDIVAYISVANGDATTAAIWKVYKDGEASGDALTLTKNELNGSILYVQNSVNVVENALRTYSMYLLEDGVLDLGTSTQHRFARFYGTGTLKVKSGTLPSSTVATFFSADGGTLEFYDMGSDDTPLSILSGITAVNNLVISNARARLTKREIEVIVYGDLTLEDSPSTLLIESPLNVKGDISIGKGAILKKGSESGSSTSPELRLTGTETQTLNIKLAEGVDAYEMQVPTVVNTAGLTLTNNVTFTSSLTLTKGVVNTGDYVLTIGETATLSGGSDQSYVDGNLQIRCTTGSYTTFPVGDGSRYGELQLQAMSADYFTVRYFNVNPSTLNGTLSDGVSYISTNEYWNVKSASEKTAYLNLRFDESSNVSYNDVMLAKLIDGTWQIVDVTDIIGTTTGTVRTKDAVTCSTDGLVITFALSELPAEGIWIGSSDTNWSNGGNWKSGSAPGTYADVTISANVSHLPVISSNDGVVILEDVTIESGATLELEAGAKMTITGELSSAEGALVINHTPDAMSSFITTTNTANNVKVVREFNAGRVYYVGSANDSGTATLSSDDCYIYDYDWKVAEYTNGNGTFGNASEGFAGVVYSTGSDSWTLTQIADISPLESRSYNLSNAPGEKIAWYMINNPYSVALPLANISVTGNMQQTVWVITYSGSEQVYNTYSIATQVGVGMSVGTVSTSAWSEGYIAPYQGFWLKVENEEKNADSVESGTATINATTHWTTSTVSLKSAAVGETDVLRLTLSSDKSSLADETAIVFREGDFYDVDSDSEKYKMGTGYNQISVLKEGGLKAIGSLPDVAYAYDTEVDLSAVAVKGATTATITATNLDEFVSSSDVYLIDRLLDTCVDLREEGSYTYTTSSSDSERFAIMLTKSLSSDEDADDPFGDVATSVEEEDNDAELVKVETFGVNGAKTSSLTRGVVLLRKTYSDGSVKVEKRLASNDL